MRASWHMVTFPFLRSLYPFPPSSSFALLLCSYVAPSPLPSPNRLPTLSVPQLNVSLLIVLNALPSLTYSPNISLKNLRIFFGTLWLIFQPIMQKTCRYNCLDLFYSSFSPSLFPSISHSPLLLSLLLSIPSSLFFSLFSLLLFSPPFLLPPHTGCCRRTERPSSSLCLHFFGFSLHGEQETDA